MLSLNFTANWTTFFFRRAHYWYKPIYKVDYKETCSIKHYDSIKLVCRLFPHHEFPRIPFQPQINNKYRKIRKSHPKAPSTFFIYLMNTLNIIFMRPIWKFIGFFKITSLFFCSNGVLKSCFNLIYSGVENLIIRWVIFLLDFWTGTGSGFLT